MKMNGDGPEMMWTIKAVWINIGIKVLMVADDCLSLDRGEPWCFLNPLRVQQRKVCLAALLGCRQLGLGGNGWYCILLINSDGINHAAHRQGHRALGAWRPDSDALDALCIYGHIQFCTHL